MTVSSDTLSAQLDRIVGSYDIRGEVPSELDEHCTYLLGVACAIELIPADGSIVIGRDMRETGEALSAAFSRGVRSQGVAVIDIGLASTDELYFASDKLGAHGAMFTASHNPAEYNGIKLCAPHARPIALETGLGQVRDRAKQLAQDGIRSPSFPSPDTSTDAPMLEAYSERLHELVDLQGINDLKVVVDAGSGMAGLTVPKVLGKVRGLEIIELNFELDGSFPVHEANPLNPANTEQLQREVVAQSADIGLAFDGDADRCFVIDERGYRVAPSALGVLVGLEEVERARANGEADPTVLYNVIASHAVSEILADIRTIRTRVGHSHIKAVMAESNALFGVEHSGHFYFRDFSRADSGLLMAMHVLRALGSSASTLSKLIEPLDPYVASGEINTECDDAAEAQQRVLAAFEERWVRDSLRIDWLDGLSIAHWDTAPKWSINLRPSNTEPLLRLNVESDDAAVLAQIVGDARASIEGK